MDPSPSNSGVEAGGGSGADEFHPDYLHSVLQHLRSRRTVQLLVAYLAASWATLQAFSMFFGGHPRFRVLFNALLVLLGTGFFVVLFGAPYVLKGRNPLRSTLIVLVTLVSLAGGFLLRGTLDGDDPGLPADSTRVAVPVDSTGSGDQAVVGRVDGAPGDGRDPPAAIDRTIADEPPTEGFRRDGDSPPGDSDRPPVDADPAETDPAETDPVAADPVEAELARIKRSLGVSDQRVVDTRAPLDLLAGFDQPVTVRFYRYSGAGQYRMNIQVGRQGARPAPMEFPRTGEPVTRRLEMETACGNLTYVMEAVREGEEAHVTIALDEEAAQRTVRQGVELGRCGGR